MAKLTVGPNSLETSRGSPDGLRWNAKMQVTIGMLTVRIFGQFSFQFLFQFSIENESKIKSKIEGSMKMNLHGTFSWKAQFLFHFWVPFFTLGFILRFKFEGDDAPGWWHVAFGMRAASFFFNLINILLALPSHVVLLCTILHWNLNMTNTEHENLTVALYLA